MQRREFLKLTVGAGIVGTFYMTGMIKTSQAQSVNPAIVQPPLPYKVGSNTRGSPMKFILIDL